MTEAADAARLALTRFIDMLVDAIGERPLGDVASVAGISERRLQRILTGSAVPDLGDVRALEIALDIDLWPQAPAAPSREDDPRPLPSMHDQRRLHEGQGRP